MVYYNENDPFAAAWLRQLIARNLIAPGDVDERDIREVTADDVRGYAQAHWFAGIGTWSYALRCAGWPEDKPVWTGSCPCQPFSAAGKGQGFKDERHLWPVWFNLIRECRPSVVFGEQVASPAGLQWLDIVYADLEGARYAVGAVDLCAAGVGAPHIRQRLWFVADAQLPEWGSLDCSRDGVARQHPVSQRQEGAGGSASRGTACRSTDGVLANAECSGRQPIADGTRCFGTRVESPWEGFQPRQHGNDAGQLAHPVSAGWSERRSVAGDGPPTGSSRADGVAQGDTVSPGLEGRRTEVRHQSKDARGSGKEVEVGTPGPSNGFWVDAEWLPCRDGKWRPVEPGTFPLAHGTPARVGRLRGYGNGIVTPVATEFIKAYLEARADLQGDNRD